MKIIYLFIISSLLISCSASKTLKQQRISQFKPSKTTYQVTEDSTFLSGTVTEAESNDPVIYGSVALYQNDVLLTGVETNFDGAYSFPNLAAGIYTMEVSYVGFPSKRITNVEVKAGFKTTLK